MLVLYLTVVRDVLRGFRIMHIPSFRFAAEISRAIHQVIVQSLWDKAGKPGEKKPDMKTKIRTLSRSNSKSIANFQVQRNYFI